MIHGPGYELHAALRLLDAQLNVTVRAPLSAVIAIFRNADERPGEDRGAGPQESEVYRRAVAGRREQ